MWERDKLFGVEKDDRLARVSKISLFMHGANEGKIKFGDGLEDYPDENISPETFDILVANPPYSVKSFKNFLRLANDRLKVLNKISNDGSEIETLFAERISQLVKPRGVAAVILPSSILNKDGKSFIAARESLLENFYLRAIVQLGSKTFGATGTNTVILFLQRIFDPPERSRLLRDSANIILDDAIQDGDEEADIFAAYTKKIGLKPDDYRKALADADDKARKLEREKIIFFGLTYRQTTLIVSAPDDIKEQEIFLGYGWSNAKGREGMVEKKRGGLLFDNDDRAADNTLAAVIRAAYRGEQLHCPALDKYFHYAALADLLDFAAADFTKTIKFVKPGFKPVQYSGSFPLVTLEDVAPFVTERTTINDIQITDYVTTDNMLKDKRGIETYSDAPPQTLAATKFSAGDVLVSNIRPYLKKIWLADRAGGCSTNVLVFRTQDESILIPEYLFAVLSDDAFFDFAMATSKGFKMPCGDKDKIKSYKFPLPPLAVQRQIVDEFTALDSKLAAQDEMLSRLDADIKAKFAALFDGKNFPRVKLGTIGKVSMCKRILKAETSDEGEIPFYKIGTFGGQADAYITREKFEAYSKNYPYPKKGDVLISAAGTIGKTVVFDGEPAYFQDSNIVWVDNDEKILRNLYLLHFYATNPWQVTRGETIQRLYNAGIENVLVPLPPLELQEEFASYVRNCEAMKKSARLKREELIRERAELVTKYFR